MKFPANQLTWQFRDRVTTPLRSTVNFQLSSEIRDHIAAETGVIVYKQIEFRIH